MLKLVVELGFDGIGAGGLDESWRQQPGSPVYTKDFDVNGVRQALSEARKDRTPEWRATANSPGTFAAPCVTRQHPGANISQGRGLRLQRIRASCLDGQMGASSAMAPILSLMCLVPGGCFP